MNPYEILELKPGATSEEIKGAYHRLAKQWHPDRYPAGPAKEEAEARFRQLSEAFVMLKDVNRRSEVEASMVTAAAATPGPQPEVVPVKDPRTKSPSDWFQDARKAWEDRDLDRALGLVQYAIRMEAGEADFHRLLADVLEARGGDKRAVVKALETVIQLAPKDVDAMLRLSEVFRGLGMSARADGLVERARVLNPGHKAFKAGPARAAVPEPQPKQEPGSPLSAMVGRIKASISLFSKRS